MPFRFLIRFVSQFASNEQLISKLAETRPIRRSAQFVAYLYHRSNDLFHSGALQGQLNPTKNRMLTFKDRFMQEFREGMKDVKNKMKQ